MASTIFKKYRSIFATTHLTAERNNLYSTINPFGSGVLNNIPLPTPMPSTILKKAPNFAPINPPIFGRTYITAERNNLRSQLLSSCDPIPILEQRVQEGKGPELQHVVQDLYDKEQFEKAAQVFEWLSNKGVPFLVVETFVQLDLIFRVHGQEAAESHFNNLNDEDKTIAVYRTLLTCYCLRATSLQHDVEKGLVDKCIFDGLVDKCIAHLQKMIELGFTYSSDCYYNLLSLYSYRGQVEKIPIVLADMREKGLSVDYIIYLICLDAYGVTSDISGMEHILKEVESQSRPDDVDWNAYLTAANVCVKAGLKEKALIYLKKCVQQKSNWLLDIDDNYLRSLDVALRSGDVTDASLYGLKKDMGFIAKLGSLVKIGKLEEAEKLFEEWREVSFVEILDGVFSSYWEWEKGEIFKIGLD